MARKLLLRFWHPPFEAVYFGQCLVFPGYHDLILLDNDLPLFNSPLCRLANALREADGALRLVDVGANVGEGVSLVNPADGDEFWLVEGSEAFLPYLRANVAGRPGVTIVPTYLGAVPSVSVGTEVVEAGNAHIRAGDGKALTFDTLDRIFPASTSASPNVLKIDVEGHEPRIFSGGREVLKRCQPVIFMEWYPRLLLREGSGVLAPFDLLAEFGYDSLMIYDNHGYLLEFCPIGDRGRLERLALYSRMRDLFYFDVIAFGSNRAELASRFRSQEEDFYRRRLGDRKG